MTSRDVRATITAGGTKLSPLSVDIDFNMARSASTFRAQLAMNDPNSSPEFWANTAPIEVDIEILGQHVFTGRCDTVGFDYHSGTISIDGRDLSSLLHEKRIENTKAFINQPRQSVVQELAGKVGLGFVGGGGGSQAGKEWKQSDFAAIEFDQSYWSIIEKFAKLDGVSAFVLDRSLYYQKDGTGSAGSFNFRPSTASQHAQGNFTNITFRRNMSLAKTLKVSVKGWHSKKMKKSEAEAMKPGQGGEMEIRTGRLNNATDEEAQKIAQNTLDDWADKEFGCSVTIPGNPSIRTAAKFSVSGTALDGSYTIEGIHHSLSTNSPYVTVMHGRRGR